MGVCLGKETNGDIHSITTKTATAPISQQTSTFTQPALLNSNTSAHATSVIGDESLPVPLNSARPRRASIQPRTATIIEEQ